MKNRILLSLCLVAATCFGDGSPFDYAESTVEVSPSTQKTLALEKDDTVVDFDVSPVRPEAAVLIKTAGGGQRILFWQIGKTDAVAGSRAWEVPKTTPLSALTYHPVGHSLFMVSGQQILRSRTNAWAPKKIYQAKRPLRRLVIGPRPFLMEYHEKTNRYDTGYRLFFGVQKPDGTYATHTVSEDGAREYTVLDSKPQSFKFADSDVQPKVLETKSGLPSGFHPGGHVMLWQDEAKCFRKAIYGRDSWENTKPFEAKALCNGSLTYTPNGAALLHWQSGMDGVTLLLDGGKSESVVAKNFRFVSTPSSVADGRGIVAVTKEGAHSALRYVPIEVPLADVVNAWMYIESPRDRELFSAHSGLFRPLKNKQLFELYDSESYHCGGYDQSTPTRPYFVTTDIFWEQYAAAFEGIFVLSEKQGAVPSFWKFVEGAHTALKAQSNTVIAQALAAVLAVKSGNTQHPEAALILQSSGVSHSTVTKDVFDFGNLKPRSHYASDPTLQTYFRASKYLMDLKLSEADLALLKKLPSPVLQEALAWVRTYIPFIAPSKRPLVWGGVPPVPAYVKYPEKREQIFPLSWGLDNEMLYSGVYHENLPEAEQVKGPKGVRVLPSGLDVAAVLGSKLAESLLEQAGEFQKYPPLKEQIEAVRQRAVNAGNKAKESLYAKWLSGLAVQWADAVSPPGEAMKAELWARKRLQTGLASWATLRHATLLVNERSVAECGEAGFEFIVHRPPRGYVEPDPATLEAIAGLFEATMDIVKARAPHWKGTSPENSKTSLQEGILRRLTESRDTVRAFRDVAKKELAGQPLTSREYEQILYAGRAAEHNLLVFKSLAQKDFALSNPDPMPKVADVAGSNGAFLLAGVGRPLEWDQVVPFYGRKEIVKGPVYAYYELLSDAVLDDGQWREKVDGLARPSWIEPYLAKEGLSCPAKTP